jgi:hypothetical protein
MIGAVCNEEFVARPSFIGCQWCDYRDLCEVGGKGEFWERNVDIKPMRESIK